MNESSRYDEALLERELGEVLRGREPGPAPYGLRGRVDRIPDEVPAGRARWDLRRAMPLVAAAAALAVLVVGSQLLLRGPAGPITGAGAGTSPAPSGLTEVVFDPGVVGMGVSTAGAGGPGGLVMLAVLFLVLVAIVARGRRRILPVGLAVVLVAWAVVAAFVPVELRVSGSGPRLNVAPAEAPPAFDQDVYYETAEAGEPFVIAIMVSADSLAPVSLEGFVAPNRDDSGILGFPWWTAAWLDEERTRHGGMSARAVPFEPFRADGRGQAVHLVGRAGVCAMGPAFDPAASAEVGFAIIDRITAQVSVLGWPRTIELLLGFKLAEPQANPCDP